MQSDGNFGASVAISGTTVIVGAPGETVSGFSFAGRFYTFSASGTLQKTLSSPNQQSSGLFGASIGISGTTILVGAYGETASGFGGAGHAYTFSSSTGALIKTFSSPNSQSEGAFGYSVGISGTTILVGAYDESASSLSTLDTLTFSVPSGTLLKTFTSPDAQSSGEFGNAVAISGTMAFIGANSEHSSGIIETGRVYVENS